MDTATRTAIPKCEEQSRSFYSWCSGSYTLNLFIIVSISKLELDVYVQIISVLGHCFMDTLLQEAYIKQIGV